MVQPRFEPSPKRLPAPDKPHIDIDYQCNSDADGRFYRAQGVRVNGAHSLGHSNPTIPLLVTFLLLSLRMATAHPLPVAASGPPLVSEPASPSAIDLENALAPAVLPDEETVLIPPNSPAAQLPVELDVAVPVRDFRVRNLLALEPGQVIETQWGHGEDVPLAAGDVQLAWSEFEVVDSQLAVRLTRLF
jgi:flagellar motor switch/type III secretory pathway protein FliN